MKNEKNGTQTGGQQKTRQSRLTPEEHSSRYYFLLLTGFLTALVLQRDFGVERFAGTAMLSTLLYFMFYRDLRRYKPTYAENLNMLGLLGLLLLGGLVLGRASGYMLQGLARGLDIGALGASVYGVPIAAGAMLATLLLDFHTALVFSFIVSVLSGLWVGEASFALYAFLGSVTASFGVIRCRRRNDILRAGLFLMAVNVFSVTAIMLLKAIVLTSTTIYAVLFAMFSALAVVAVVSIMLPILENLFKVTTDISLLELLDLNHPLMRNLMLNAPGTYHHSIVVGNLVEAAAEKIGVNPLLGRVCAYYHDIGKVRMPDYFIENQFSGKSRHESITPHMSSMVLVSHVKEGSELARHYNLPPAVIDIIEQHHGTSLITYFYEKARGAIAAEEELSKDEYKYPGPKPQSKIAALIMMADAVDAASRVLTDPSPTRITALVNRIINHIFLEGQLDECELTLKDIREIKLSFIYIMTGILHKRINYPGFDFDGETKQDAASAIERPGSTDDNRDKKQLKTDDARRQKDKDGVPQGAKVPWD